jgi:ElaB/YqjD/DUF883 family membrane-anchored ribosome-binding protein
MTRYVPNNTGQGRFGPGNRPPLDLLPKPIAALLTEHDRAFTCLAKAREDAAAVTGEDCDLAARVADEAAAATAARVGKPIPAAVNAEKLLVDRATTARAVTAHTAALAAIVNDLNAVVSDEFFSTQEKATAARAKARAGLDNLIDQLATAVETAVAAGAARAWMGTGSYYADCRTWAVDVIPDLARHGLHHDNSTHYPVRAILRAAATTVLED